MPQRTLRFKIYQDGRVQETVEGFEGDSCNDATKNLEDALGEVKTKKLTTDSFVINQVNNSNQLKNESNVTF
tara:strand:+ start:157 stop:372 length:216 start_codon:yes stop_codon:yes gene_type:complete